MLQLTGIRVLWSQARDGQMPAAGWMRKVSKQRIPINATLTILAMALLFGLWSSLLSVLAAMTALAWGFAYAIVVTVGSIHGGTKHNIISDEVKMQLTVRTYKQEVRDRVLLAIERIAKGIATTGGVPPDRAPIVQVEKDQYTPATYNNPELTKRVSAALKAAIGADNVIPKDPTMGGEDFSEYSLPDHSIPAMMFNVGAVDPAKAAESKKPGAAPLPSLHSSKFAPVPEPTIRTGMIGMTSAVLDLMKK